MTKFRSSLLLSAAFALIIQILSIVPVSATSAYDNSYKSVPRVGIERIDMSIPPWQRCEFTPLSSFEIGQIIGNKSNWSINQSRYV